MSYKIPGLQAARVAAGLSITRLARLSNVSDNTIRRLEDNALAAQAAKLPFTVHQEDAQRIAEALGSDLATLGAVDINA